MSRIFKTKNLLYKHLGLAILGKKTNKQTPPQMDFFHTDLLENKCSEARVSIHFLPPSPLPDEKS